MFQSAAALERSAAMLVGHGASVDRVAVYAVEDHPFIIQKT